MQSSPALLPADNLDDAPLAIGGVGGSGTRVVSAAAIELGYDMGRDLNVPLDNLAFTLLFKEPGVLDLPPGEFLTRARLFSRAMAGGRALSPDELALVAALSTLEREGGGRVQHDGAWLAERAQRLAASALQPRSERLRWGWKEPNTHIVLPRLLAVFPRLRYVHVVRNGLDMAFSRNRNQLLLWGERMLGRPVRDNPADALAYWCAVHRRIRLIGESMPGRFLWLDYDKLCADPGPGFAALVRFLGLPAATANKLVPLAKPQPTSGRHRRHPLDGFAQADMDYLRSIGHLPASVG